MLYFSTLPRRDIPGGAEKKVLKVFIADDSDAVRGRLRELVSEVEGVTVVGEASDGAEALEGIDDYQPHVVILDVRMPRRNGFEVLEETKKRDEAPVVIVLTAFAYQQYRERCLDAGAAHFFDKTTEFERVTEVLKVLSSDRGGGALICRRFRPMT